jgi:ABC-type lipoprotein export system ATPase subunit
MAKHIIQAINFNISNVQAPKIGNLNWVVDEADWIEIQGDNNSGKTTLLNALYGYLAECTGQLFVLDYSMTPIGRDDLAALRRKMGYARQEIHLVKTKTLRANMAMALNAADRIIDTNYEGIIENILERFSLLGYIKKEIRELSASQQHLAAIARSLVHKPKLILLDQSFDCLDDIHFGMALDIIKDYRNSDRLTVISTCLRKRDMGVPDAKTYRLENGALIAAV